jgi:ribonuclease HII
MVPKPDLSLEEGLWPHYPLIAGLDEAGRGALAGPVAVGAVVLPVDPALVRTLDGVRDSKLMTPRQRSRWAIEIKSNARAWQVGFASPDEIDAYGIVASIRLAAMRALESLSLSPAYLLTDFRLDLPELDFPQTSLVKGDQRSLSIAAASVLAKTSRDTLMQDLDAQYPGYELGRHKGYGTQAHRSAVKRLGPSPIHRKTFRIK